MMPQGNDTMAAQRNKPLAFDDKAGPAIRKHHENCSALGSLQMEPVGLGWYHPLGNLVCLTRACITT
jgi:hypothetical protein